MTVRQNRKFKRKFRFAAVKSNIIEIPFKQPRNDNRIVQVFHLSPAKRLTVEDQHTKKEKSWQSWVFSHNTYSCKRLVDFTRSHKKTQGKGYEEVRHYKFNHSEKSRIYPICKNNEAGKKVNRIFHYWEEWIIILNSHPTITKMDDGG